MKDIGVFFAMRRFVGACLVSAVLFVWPLFASGQQFPQLGAQKDQKPAASSLTALLETDAAIDKEVERIKGQVDKLLAESTSAQMEVTAGGVLGLVASPEEMKEKERIRSQLLIDLDTQIDVLKELKEIRKDNASYVLERKSWKGFAEKPPFPIKFIDDILDSVLSKRLSLESYELRLSLTRASFTRFDEALKKSRQALRLAEEEVSRSVGTSREQRNRWLLDLAKLKNDRNEAGLVLAELRRLSYETAVKGKRLQIAFLEEKLSIAEASSPLSKEDLDKKLSDLDGQRRDLEVALLSAQKKEAEERKKLDVSRDAMAGLSATGQLKQPLRDQVKRNIQAIVPHLEGKMSREELNRLIVLDFEAEQAIVETLHLKVTALKGRIQIVNVAEETWQDRYWLTGKRDLKQVREKRTELAKTLARLGLFKKISETNLSNWMNIIKNQKDKIGSLEKSDPAMKLQEVILKTYGERQDIWLGLIEEFGRLERLMNRLNDELTRRINEASISGRAKEQTQIAYSFFKQIWNTELYVVTETTVVEDRSIVRPVSVTVGKVVMALIMLFIGTWIAAKIGRAIQWIMRRRLYWADSKTEPVRKIIFGAMFVCVLIMSFVMVNIPLTVFAFLGGALAIGLGFGAQHLINNFISSLILLFDRSIRVGDIVEVDGEGGRVTDIGMRNSRIHRFDGVDMLVPNSKFLQEKVTNWTLDPKMRYSITVSVAYGSPTRETERVIMKAIETHPMVLKDPPPTVIFEQFGDSALVFTGQFWMALISNRDNRIAASEIRHQIAELLEKGGIVISFPQRDVHLDSSKPIEVRVIPSRKEAE